MHDTSRMNESYWSGVLTEHFSRLGVKTPEEYFDLCRSYGLSETLLKDKSELKQERRSISSGKLIQKRIKVNTYKSKNTKFDDFISPLKESNDYKENLRSFLTFLDKKTKLLKGRHDVERMTTVFKVIDTYRVKRLQHWDTWKSQTYNADRQFSSLVRHLFCKYDVPSFMDSAWDADNINHIGNSVPAKYVLWFISLGQGKNIREFDDTPFPLTKKMAHHFLQAPNNYDINEAFYWGYVHANKGNARTSDGLRGTKLTEAYVRNDVQDFYFSVIRFFIDNPMLDTRQYGPIVDYIFEKKYANRREFVERGVAVNLPPEQPGFSMNGRDVNTLLEQVEEWHVRLGKESKTKHMEWVHCSTISDFEIQYGSTEKKNVRFYKIQQLLNSKELSSEGRKMRHCVGSYSHSCSRGQTSIWSMTLENYEGVKNMITIEVNPRTKGIGQVQARLNARPDQQSVNILNKWAVKEGLQIANYLRL